MATVECCHRTPPTNDDDVDSMLFDQHVNKSRFVRGKMDKEPKNFTVGGGGGRTKKQQLNQQLILFCGSTIYDDSYL